jgi:hypothetical protein
MRCFKGQSIEGYDDGSGSDTKVNTELLGMSIGMGILFFVIALIIWIWAIVVTVKYWKQLPTWSRVLSVIGLVTGVGGPFMNLIVVYIGKEQDYSKCRLCNRY